MGFGYLFNEIMEKIILLLLHLGHLEKAVSIYSTLYGDYPRQKNVAVTHLSLASTYLAEAVQSARVDGLEEFRIANASVDRTQKPVLKRSVTELFRTQTKILYAKMEEHCQTALQIQRRLRLKWRQNEMLIIVNYGLAYELK